MDRSRCVLAGLAATALAGGAQASVIDSASFFTSIPHTLIDFETDHNGDPLDLIDGQSQVMPTTAYQSMGLIFVTPIRWVNDGSAAFDAAQGVGGSPDHAIPSSFHNVFEMSFTVPVRAMGMWVVNNADASTLPTFVAYDSANQVIDTAVFSGPLVDGTVTVGGTTAQYGFMGILADRDIARVEITKQFAILDDLRFSAVPAPGGVGLACGALAMGLRRRR